jgi:vacuolar-type H+-ATPase subunit C/Vma6
VPQGYGYGNARLRAMRGRLLKEADYLELLRKASIEEFITALTETPYKEDVEAALLRVGGAPCVYEAVRTNLTRTLRKICDFFQGKPSTLVSILLRRWDRHNLLTILRGQSREVSAEMVLSAIVPVGQLDELVLRELARQPGLRATLDLMNTWQLPYAKALRRVQARAGAVTTFDTLELALNRFHYASLRESLSRGNGNHDLVREQLAIEIDLINISTALRLVRRPDLVSLVQRRYHATDVRPLLIEPGGYLSSGRLARLVAEASGLEGVLRGLSDTRYGPGLEAGWSRSQSGGSIPVLIRELERWQANRIAAMFSRDSLSIAIPIGYLGCKELEIANLRLLAQAVALDIKREQVRRDLIIV